MDRFLILNNYDFDKPLSTENPISLDIYTGGLQFTPTKVESTIFRVKISEYRDSKLIGYFYRDYYIAVLETPENACATNYQ
jgi:hypothetical protein